MIETRLRGEDLFDSLNIEKISRDETLKRCSNLSLEYLCDEFELWYRHFLAYRSDTLLKDLVCCSKDISDFVILARKYDEKYGFEVAFPFFISEIINNSMEKDFQVNVGHFINKRFSHFANKNKKNVKFLGNVGDGFGCRNTGNITLNGNVLYSAGDEMSQGRIDIYGDAEMYLGHQMTNGEIHIYGNAGGGIGHQMNGGSIFLYGDYKHIGKVYKGDIYHKGKQIVKDGRRIE